MVKLNSTLEITPIKFDTDSWKNFSTGYKITCVNYTQEEIMHFRKVTSYAQRKARSFAIVFELDEALQIVKDFYANTPTLHTIMSTSNHPVFSDNFRSEII